MLARFILQTNHFRKSDNTVKWNAFLPNSRGETSVYQISTLSDAQTWDIGRGVANSTVKDLYGRADVPSAAVLDNGLQIVYCGPIRHANIIGWPAEKEAKKEIALILEDVAVTYIL